MPPLKREVAKICKFSPEGLSPQIKHNSMCRKDSAESQYLSHIAYIYDPEGSLHQQIALSFINMLDCKQAKYA